jgi:hypothetical protein
MNPQTTTPEKHLINNMKINPKTKAKIVEAARIDILFLMSSTAD